MHFFVGIFRFHAISIAKYGLIVTKIMDPDPAVDFPIALWKNYAQETANPPLIEILMTKTFTN